MRRIRWGGAGLGGPPDSPRGRRAAVARAGPIGTPACRPNRLSGPQRRRGGSRDLPVAPADRDADLPLRSDPAQLRLRPRVPSPARRPVAPDPGAQGGRRPAHASRETLPLKRRDVVAPAHHELLDLALAGRRPVGPRAPCYDDAGWPFYSHHSPDGWSVLACRPAVRRSRFPAACARCDGHIAAVTRLPLQLPELTGWPTDSHGSSLRRRKEVSRPQWIRCSRMSAPPCAGSPASAASR